MLQEARGKFRAPDKQDKKFADFLEYWLEEVEKPNIKPITYSGYCYNINKIIVPYFRKKDISLTELTHKYLEQFYSEQLKRVKATSVIRYHANIRKALKYAVRMDFIPSNPADNVDRPKKRNLCRKLSGCARVRRSVSCSQRYKIRNGCDHGSSIWAAQK